LKILLNALSVDNLSSRFVLLGYLKQILEWCGEEEFTFLILYRPGNRDMVADMGPAVEWIACPAMTDHWAWRAWWERRHLQEMVIAQRADCYFTPSGIAARKLPAPQVVFAQNPWAMVRGVRRGVAGTVKAFFQRQAYRRTLKLADVMVFNSEFMQAAYRENAGCMEKESTIVYQAIDEATHQQAREAAAVDIVDRHPNRILCVSVYGHHKGVETIIDALAKLRDIHGRSAELDLVGPWPHPNYRAEMENAVRRFNLQDQVHFHGHVSTEELMRFNANARVFCLMSHCESFGIPAVEAQCFGTPVVSSDCCAIPEICGAGGLFPPVGDSEAVATALNQMLGDDVAWARFSKQARENTTRFHWELCSRPLLDVFRQVARQLGDGTTKEVRNTVLSS
jgi:glycosyltransferase involved in cell wall biosynthesis